MSKMPMHWIAEIYPVRQPEAARTGRPFFNTFCNKDDMQQRAPGQT